MPRPFPGSSARGVGFVDDLARDVFYAFRTFRRAPLAALTVVATVALGLGLVAVVFTVYNFLMLRVDAVRSPGELFAVKLSRPAGPGTDDEAMPLARLDYESMRRETSVFTEIVAMLDGDGARPTRRPARAAGLCDRNFFQAMGIQARSGAPFCRKTTSDSRDAG